MSSAAADSDTSRLPENMLRFAALLRQSGIQVGIGQVLDAMRAIELIGLHSADDFYHCLLPLFVKRQEHQALFAACFARFFFWQGGVPLADLCTDEIMQNEQVSAAFRADHAQQESQNDSQKESQLELTPEPLPETAGRDQDMPAESGFGVSAQERLRQLDFAQMSASEKTAAKALLARIHLPELQRRSRRFQVSNIKALVDGRGTLQAALRNPDAITLRYKQRRPVKVPLVILSDISGSMQHYSQMLLHFMHAVTAAHSKVHAFVFATRLSNISPYLRHRYSETALQQAVESVQDWSGGTRLGACLEQFNRQWSRRVLGQGAIVLLITDGLERGDPEQLKRTMERLAKSSQRLIWLNPLLRYRDFQPRAQGIQAMLPWVDDFLPAHNVECLQELALLLQQHFAVPARGTHQYPVVKSVLANDDPAFAEAAAGL